MSKKISRLKKRTAPVSQQALVVLPVGDSRFGQQYLNGITHTLAVRDWTVLHVDSTGRGVPWEHMNTFSGMVLYPAGLEISELQSGLQKLQSCNKDPFPVVFCEQRYDGLAGDLIATDYSDLAYRLTRMLCERGHCALAFAGEQPSLSVVEAELLEGYRRALRESLSSENDPFCVRLDDYSDDYDRDVLLAMARKEPATAFFCTNPHVARRVERQLIHLGHTMGDSIELASMDDEGVTEEYGTPLLRVKRSAYDLGVGAAELLLDRIAQPGTPFQERRIKAGPVITGTTGNTIERPRTRFMKRL